MVEGQLGAGGRNVGGTSTGWQLSGLQVGPDARPGWAALSSHTEALSGSRERRGRSCEGGCARVSRADKSQGGSGTQAEDAIAANGGLSIETANGKQRGPEGFRGGCDERQLIYTEAEEADDG